MAYNLPSVQMPDIAGGMAAGYQQGAAIREDKRRQPILAQLDALKMKQQEQALERGKKQMTLTDMEIRQKELADTAKSARWAAAQPNPAAAWDHVVDFKVQTGETDFEIFRQYNTPEFLDMMASVDQPGGLDKVRNVIQGVGQDDKPAYYTVRQSGAVEPITQVRPLSEKEKTEQREEGKGIGFAKTADIRSDAERKIAEAKESGKVKGKGAGEEEKKLSDLEAGLPALQEVVDNLKELGKVATYTKTGRIFDAAVRELGFGVPEGATARAKLIAVIDNEVLPLLKATFGAAFTVEEGKQLKATLGDPDLSPEEKDAQLDALIERNIREIQTQKRKVGEPVDTGATEKPESSKAADELQQLKQELGI